MLRDAPSSRERDRENKKKQSKRGMERDGCRIESKW